MAEDMTNQGSQANQAASDAGNEAAASPASAPGDGQAVSANNAAKLQAPQGQAKESFVESKPVTDAAKAPAQKPDAAKPDPNAAKPSFEPEDLKWLESKGMKADTLDPANEAVKTLIKNGRAAESEMSRAQQAAKAKELAESATKVPDPAKAKPEQRKTEIEKFEEFHGVIVDNIAASLGITADDLAANYPDVAARLNHTYAVERQKAWEREQAALADLKTKTQTEAQEKARFQSELKESETTMTNNFLNMKAKEPGIEKMFKDSGAETVLAELERQAAWPKSFTLSDPKLFAWFAKASKAIQVLDNLDNMKGEWRKEYEADLKKQSEAALVPASTDTGNSNAAAKLQKITRGGF